PPPRRRRSAAGPGAATRPERHCAAPRPPRCPAARGLRPVTLSVAGGRVRRMEVSTVSLVVTAVLALLVGVVVGALLAARLLSGRRTSAAEQLDLSTSATSQAVAPVKESLDRFDDRLRQLEASRV